VRLLYICLTLIASLTFLTIPVQSSALECIDTKFLFDIKPGANQPSDLALAPNGDIYLVDGVNNRIIVVGSEGQWKFAFGTKGSGKGQFKLPVGIDISDAGKVFVADTGNHRIQVFDLTGKFQYMFTVKTGSSKFLSDPVDVAVSKLDDYLYVSDNDNHKIRAYKQNGTLEFEVGGFGEDRGNFRYPAQMAINDHHELYVVDVLNTRIQKFTPFGEYLSDIGAWGVLEGTFFRPKGVFVDNKTRVFVSDSYMGVVQVFSDFGKYLGVICDKGAKRVFNSPVGIILDKDNRLLVVEMQGNKITVLKLNE
jgi:DNA-binding beta-propeller fold protein YncE